ncbi:MMPL family transporter [soil metagenome]
MRRALAAVWLAIVTAAAVYLTVLGLAGFPIRTDLLALLPREERDPVVAQANQAVSRSLGRRLLLAFGDADRGRARAAAEQAGAAIAATGLVEAMNGAALQDTGRRMGAFYFSHRDALLSAADRTALEQGRAGEIASRSLAQAFSFGSPVDAGLLAADPFLLLPSFLSSLPSPTGRLVLDDGLLTTVEDKMTWVVLPMVLKHDPYDLDVQERLIGIVDGAVANLARQMPDVKVLRLGAIFFADYGARTAIDEMTLLTILEIVGTILLIVGVFRRLSPLLLNLLALGVGIAVAFAGTFLVFGEIHVAALLFGTSLIGVAVDYGLHYCTTAFGTVATSGRQRLSYVLPGITLGLFTTLIGYSALALAPFPGLKQIAVFALIGLLAAFATVTLWFPLLDRLKPLGHGAAMLRIAALPWTFWIAPGNRLGRGLLIAVCLLTLGVGLSRYHADDDVRRLQTLSPSLLRQQDEIRRLVGATTDAQHLLVAAANDEVALQREEALIPILDRLVAERAIAGYQMPAGFMPSLARQNADRQLVKDRLVEPLLAKHVAQLGMATPPSAVAPTTALTVTSAIAKNALPLLPDLVVAPGVHIVGLLGLARPDLVRSAMVGQADVRFIDPTADFSRLLGDYRTRAILLTMVSVVLVSFLLAWRYGLRGAFWTILPPIIAALLVPALISLGGEPFTFFHAMGLVLVVAIGVDYTIFCVETPRGHHSVTMLAILLATITTMLSFGLLGLSSVLAVRAFGFTMLIGITAAYLFAPLAARATVRATIK